MASSDLLRMGDERYISLTTFRRDGQPVATAVWVARGQDALLVTTGGASGKVRRLRNESRVEVRPCTREGAVADDAPAAHGRAEVVDDAAEAGRLRRAIEAKYGDACAASVVARGGAQAAPSVMIRITG